MLQALIFDFDGLILDTETIDFAAWQDIFREHGHTLAPDTFLAGIGTTGIFDPATDLARLLDNGQDVAALNAHHRQRHLALSAQEPIRPGVRPLIAAARAAGLGLAVASSSRHEWVDGHLARLGMSDTFDAVRCRDDVGDRAKPDPAVYQAALDALGVAAETAVAFEDSHHGVTAARAAGLYTVAVPNDVTRHLDLSHASVIVASLADITLERLMSAVGGVAS